MDLAELLELEAIKRLKYRYMRSVDLHLWDELAECFTVDAVARYSDGAYTFEGRDSIVGFLRQGLTSSVLSLHTAHHPEIDLTGPTTATGIWALEDTVFKTDVGEELHGAGYYSDTYAKIDGAWKIASTGYQRTFEHRTTSVRKTPAQ